MLKVRCAEPEGEDCGRMCSSQGTDGETFNMLFAN